jgi:hypothetical protein
MDEIVQRTKPLFEQLKKYLDNEIDSIEMVVERNIRTAFNMGREEKDESRG